MTNSTNHPTSLPGLSETATPETLVERYHRVRQFTEQLCQPLVTEDYVIQAIAGCESAKVASGAHELVFRDLYSGISLSSLSSREMPPMGISSIPITWRLASGIAGLKGDFFHVQRLRRYIVIEPM